MNPDFLVVLDACVLVPASRRDALLRFAEEPRLYMPRWSDEIISEMVRTLESEIGLAPEKTKYLVTELKKHFGDSWVTAYEPLLGHLITLPFVSSTTSHSKGIGCWKKCSRCSKYPTRYPYSQP